MTNIPNNPFWKIIMMIMSMKMKKNPCLF